MEENTKMKKRELFQPSDIKMREVEGSDEMVITGDAIMCDVETILWEGETYREIEIIAPSCIAPEFIEAQNMFINAQHERGKTFGRQGAKLNVIAGKDRVSCECKGTSNDFRETCAKINDGVYTGMSFEFWPKKYEQGKRTGADGKTEYVIRHTEFAAIDALTVAMKPVYPTTSIGLREMIEEHESLVKREEDEANEEEAKKQKEAEDLEKAQREQAEMERLHRSRLRELYEDMDDDDMLSAR